MKKWVVYGLVGFFVILFITGGWFWYGSVKEKQVQIEKKQQEFQSTGTTDIEPEQIDMDVSHWKKYHNEKIKMEFRYPYNWSIEELDFFDFYKITINNGGYSIYGWVVPIKGNVNFKTAQEKYNDTIGIQYSGVSYVSSKINNFNIRKYPYVKGSKVIGNQMVSFDSSSTVVFLPNFYIIHFMYFLGDNNQENIFMENMLQQIVSTINYN